LRLTVKLLAGACLALSSLSWAQEENAAGVFSLIVDDGSVFASRTESHCGDLKQVNPTLFGPTRNQGTLGVCYAYATTDLLNYCIEHTKCTSSHSCPFVTDPKSVPQLSSFDFAIQNAKPQWNGQSLDDFITALNQGGDAYLAMKRLGESVKKPCLDKNFPSDRGSFERLTGKDDSDFFPSYGGPWIPDPKNPGKLTKALQTQDQQDMGTTYLIKKFERLQNEYDHTGTLACADSKSDTGCFHQLGTFKKEVFGDQEFMAILQKEKASPAKLVIALDDIMCTEQNRVSLSGCAVHSTYLIPKNSSNIGHQALPELDAQLAAGSPVEIGVGSSFLNSAQQTGGGNHAMIVIGRHWRPAIAAGEVSGCYYQIRNSWGHQCGSYSSSSFVKDCDPATGYFWISEETLSKNLLTLDYFPNH